MNRFLETVHDIAGKMQRLCKEPVWIEIEDPASEREVTGVESKLGYRLPDSLREFFRTCSAKAHLSWYFEWDFSSTLPEFLREVKSGTVSLCLEDQSAWKENWSDWEPGIGFALSPNGKVKYHFSDLHPFMQAGNGDTLLLVRTGTNQDAVLLEGFETSNLQCARLGRTFEEFLHLWGALAFAGPEEWAVRPFYDREADMLSISCPEAIRWNRIWRGESDRGI